jgi:putative cardiolipin synthase
LQLRNIGIVGCLSAFPIAALCLIVVPRLHCSNASGFMAKSHQNPHKKRLQVLMARHQFFLALSSLALSTCLHGCARLPIRPPDLAPSHALADPLATTWGRHFARKDDRSKDLSGFHVLQAGVDGLAARIQLIRGAERTLDLQYFIFRGDATGSLIRQELRKAAERGVRVRVLVDDGDTTAGDERILELDGYHDMQVRVFNPFSYRGHNRILRNLDFVVHKNRLDYRMHNKLMIADNAVALVGGRNIGNQYFQVDPASQYADDDVFTVGATVPVLSGSFDEFWNSDLAIPAVQLTRLKSSRAAATFTPLASDYFSRIESGQPLSSMLSESAPLTWADGRVLYDSPQKRLIERRESHGRLMSGTVEKEIEESTKDLVIVSPYFVPSDHELELLKSARSRNTTVQVLTNSLESNPDLAAHTGYEKVRVPLLQSGVTLYEIRARLDSVRGSGENSRIARYGTYALHGKMYVFDRRRVLLGSWNYDQRSLRINTEIGVLIDSPTVAAEVLHRFEEMVSPKASYQVVLESSATDAPQLLWKTELDQQQVRLKVEPSRGWWQRLKARTLALLPIQPEL